MKKLFSIYVFLLLVYPNIAISEYKQVEVPFLFTEDEELESISLFPTDKSKTTVEDKYLKDKSKAILNDKFLNEPLTKLDFILMQMNEKMDEIIKTVKEDFKYLQYFEKKEKWIHTDVMEFTVDGAVTFVRDLGKIEVSLTIENMGKPRIPMKQICEHIMQFTHIGIYFPQRKRGFYYHNKYLNELNRRDGFQNYEASLEKIANNVI